MRLLEFDCSARRRNFGNNFVCLGLVDALLNCFWRGFDKSLRRGLQITNGDLAPFFMRPVCALLAAITLFTLAMYVPPINRRVHAAVDSAWSAIKGILEK